MSVNENIVYRVVRRSENPIAGLRAKDQTANKEVFSHVNKGSDPNYKSQFISTTKSLEVAQNNLAESQDSAIAIIDLTRLPKGSRVIDLTSEENRNKYLKNSDRVKNYARKSQEILIENKEGSIPFTWL